MTNYPKAYISQDKFTQPPAPILTFDHQHTHTQGHDAAIKIL